MHPIGGLDHALAMIGLGIIAGLIGGRALWLVPATFVVFMAVIAEFHGYAHAAELPLESSVVDYIAGSSSLRLCSCTASA